MYQLNGTLDVVVLTIGTEERVTRELLDVVNMRNWSSSAFHFERYLTSLRHPSIGQYISSSNGCLAFVDYDRNPDEAAETAQYLSKVYPGKVLIVAVGKRPSSTAILVAMRAGCSEYFTKHSPPQELDVLLDRFQQQCFTEVESHATNGAVLSVLGAKGGVGATSIAVHLATYLAQYHQRKTLLIDQQQMLGHACVYLGIDGEHHTLGEVVRNLKRMDSELLRGFVAHHFSGLDVLSSPDASSDQDLVPPQEFVRTLEFLRGEYDYVILDCDRRQPDLWPSLATASSEILMVATPEVAAVRDLSRIADGLVVTEGTSSKLKVILNRYNAPHALAADQIENVLKLPIALKLQDSPGEMVFASNSGKTLKYPGPSQLATALHGWSSKLADINAKPASARKQDKSVSRWRQLMPAW
ncbi:AAA family ATPase [Terriglobus sp. TAA 43]|uniref:AAA family ATPase n=1 Tax=Terriglobus sp. TAA 43 TaxID=278961 RepID=UPI0018DCD6F7|nr:AAA family ATPase [Terriglobus sp. TAA 43]